MAGLGLEAPGSFGLSQLFENKKALFLLSSMDKKFNRFQNGRAGLIVKITLIEGGEI